MNSNRRHQQTESSEIDYRGQNLSKIPSYQHFVDCSSIFLQHNKISSFKGLKTIAGLKKLFLDSNNISTFKHAAPQPSLTVLSISKNPISSEKYIGLMSFIVFGDNLKMVNHNPISFEERSLGKKLRPLVIKDLLNEWMIRSLNPIILADSNSLLEKKIDISQLEPTPKSSKSSNGKNSPSNHKIDDLYKNEIRKSPVPGYNSNNEEKIPFYDMQNKKSPKVSRTNRSRSHIYDPPQLKRSSLINYPERKDHSPKSKNSLLEAFNFDSPYLEKRQKNDKIEKRSIESDHNSEIENELSLSISHYENLPLETLNFKENSNFDSEPTKNCLNSDDSLTLIMTNNENSKKKHVPPPLLNFSPISSDESDSESSELKTEELYEKFYRKHINEITTPQDAKYYVLKHKKERSSRKMKIRNA